MLPTLRGGLSNDGFIRTDPLATASLTPYTITTDDGLVIADIDGTLITKLQFTGNNTDVLLGDGTWGAGGGGFSTCVSPTTFGGSGGAVNLNNTDNFHFLGNNSGSLMVDNVMIGATFCVTPSAKLHVLQNVNAPSSIGILAENNDLSSTTNPTVGLKSILPTDSSCSAIAAWLEAPSANIAVCQPYALFVPHNGGRISINHPYNDPAAIPWMFALNGAANSPVGWFTVSDQTFKMNLNAISNPLEKIKNINGVYFEFDTLNYPNYNFPAGKQVGFIAQNVDTILPEAVSDNGGPLSLDYAKITPLLLEAVKSLTKKVETLETQLNQCCQNNNQNNSGNSNNPQMNELGNSINAALSNGDTIVLEQNVPNPFAENTSINYFIPENIGYAQIIFTDMQGPIIKTLDIKQSGKGQLKVYAAHLSQGIYQYSIVVDGKMIDTKKMLVEK
ncbi:MAG: tail fiber domain-containing protein [Flavobacteriales bacterium]|nr:tail fiber domain-containing protein [Flavobacteriales bacterium]